MDSYSLHYSEKNIHIIVHLLSILSALTYSWYFPDFNTAFFKYNLNWWEGILNSLKYFLKLCNRKIHYQVNIICHWYIILYCFPSIFCFILEVIKNLYCKKPTIQSTLFQQLKKTSVCQSTEHIPAALW